MQCRSSPSVQQFSRATGRQAAWDRNLQLNKQGAQMTVKSGASRSFCLLPGGGLYPPAFNHPPFSIRPGPERHWRGGGCLDPLLGKRLQYVVGLRPS